MRICLINPPCSLRQADAIKRFVPVIPLGLAYIASSLEEKNHAVHIIDAPAEGHQNRVFKDGVCTIGLSWEMIEKRIKQYMPDLVGISCPFSSRFSNALRVAKIVKEVGPTIKTMIGGVHSSILPNEVLKNSEIDFVIIGEGEVSTLELVKNLEKNLKDFSSIDGLGYKKDGKIIVNPKTEFISDLDSIPFPARHLFPMKEYFKVKKHKRANGKYSIRNVQRNSIVTSRGCPFNCTFCSIHSIWGHKWRARSPENVIKEIKQLQKEYGIVEISFDDDNIAFNRQRIMEICELIVKENIKIRWDTPNGISMHTLDKELLTMMKKSGCSSLNLAIESGDPYILKNVIRKTHIVDKVKKVVLLCKEIGIKTLAYFVIGMPGETKESVQRSIEFAKSLPIDELNVFIATPYPGTQLYEQCIKKGYISKYNFEDYIADDDYQQKTAIINTPQLSASDLISLRSQFYDEFNKSRE